jgi:hypothetical protein
MEGYIMTRNWIVVPPPGILFDAKTGNILLKSGTVLANVWIDKVERFHIHLSNINSYFTSDIKRITGTGWDGDEGHMGDIIWLSDEGGTLEYQRYRHEFLKKREEKISIKIMMVRGETIPFPKIPSKNKGRWRKTINALKEFFSPWSNELKT